MKKFLTGIFLLYFVLWLPLTAQQDFCGCARVMEKPAKEVHSCCAEMPVKQTNPSHCGQQDSQQSSGILQILCQQSCLSPDVVVEQATGLQILVPAAAQISNNLYHPNAPPAVSRQDIPISYKSPPLYLLAQSFLI